MISTVSAGIIIELILRKASDGWEPPDAGLNFNFISLLSPDYTHLEFLRQSP